ncbi:hypothetical protein JDFnp4_127 [Fusobacterium phage JD-Fnp4]|nr:hypothetical protein JDFnp4_127 [Fusobacterium phage JD-Fnp4]
MTDFGFLNIKENLGIKSEDKHASEALPLGSIVISKPKTPFVEDLEYLIEDFGKLKSRLRFEKLSEETKDALLDNYEEKLARFLKRYKDR